MAGRLRRWWRSAATGRFVSRRFNRRHPRQAVEETEKAEEPDEGDD